MINRCRNIFEDGELFFIATPEQCKVARYVIIEIYDSSDYHTVVDLKKPPVTEPATSSTSNDHSKVRYDKSLGGELERSARYLV